MPTPSVQIPIEVSARHVHLTQEAVEKLFGPNYSLTSQKELSQPGTFAAEETVTLRNSHGQIANVRILGPVRDYNQIEISRTDARQLKVDPPIRDTHEIEQAGTPGVILEGPQGSLALEKGVIVAWRHLHLSTNEALELELQEGQLVKIDIDNDPRSVVFENVLVRVAPNYKMMLHIDTDEANAAGIETGEKGILIS